MACPLSGARPLSEPMMTYCQLNPREHISMKYCLKFKCFHSRKCIWKCRLENSSHFVSTSMCLVGCPLSTLLPCVLTSHGTTSSWWMSDAGTVMWKGNLLEIDIPLGASAWFVCNYTVGYLNLRHIRFDQTHTMELKHPNIGQSMTRKNGAGLRWQAGLRPLFNETWNLTYDVQKHTTAIGLVLHWTEYLRWLRENYW